MMLRKEFKAMISNKLIHKTYAKAIKKGNPLGFPFFINVKDIAMLT
jgi:hypothetical protein